MIVLSEEIEKKLICKIEQKKSIDRLMSQKDRRLRRKMKQNHNKSRIQRIISCSLIINNYSETCLSWALIRPGFCAQLIQVPNFSRFI
jgi:hypothetical protein